MAGAPNSLSKIKAVELELSLKPLYESSADYLDMIDYMRQRNFILSGLEPGFYDRASGKLLQFDGFFLNQDLT